MGATSRQTSVMIDRDMLALVDRTARAKHLSQAYVVNQLSRLLSVMDIDDIVRLQAALVSLNIEPTELNPLLPYLHLSIELYTPDGNVAEHRGFLLEHHRSIPEETK